MAVLGLGLAIADALAKMHGGRLDAQSEGVGHGATFSFQLELAATGQSFDRNGGPETSFPRGT